MVILGSNGIQPGVLSEEAEKMMVEVLGLAFLLPVSFDFENVVLKDADFSHPVSIWLMQNKIRSVDRFTRCLQNQVFYQTCEKSF